MWAHLSLSQPSRAERKHESPHTSSWLCQAYLNLRHGAEFVPCSPDIPLASQWAKRQKADQLGPHLTARVSGHTSQESLALSGVLVKFITPTWEQEEV